MPNQSQRTFAGIPPEYGRYEDARVVLIPVPYDGTSTWIKGADKGPDAFLDAAANMELYDIETDSEPYRHGIFLDTPVSESRSPEAMVDAVRERVAARLADGKLVTLIGGEHSISIGGIRAFMQEFDNLSVLQLDAHADLRESYEGSRCSHACAVHEAAHKANLVQVGIRSMDLEEKPFMDTGKMLFADALLENEHWMDQAIDRMTRDVYITIDLDVLDPSIMPSTGTPEPGGLGWRQILKFVDEVSRGRNVVGFDMVELCPNKHNKAPDFLAAKLYYKILSYLFRGEQ